MQPNYAILAENYYKTIASKNLTELEKYLHPDVQFDGPLAKASGKANVLELTRQFTTFFTSLKIRSKFASKDQAVIVYDVEFPPPISPIASTALLTYKDGLVVKVELFYDASPFRRS